MVEATYRRTDVERLMGLREGGSATGTRHITGLDILSLLRDPGGDRLWASLARKHDPADAWMAARGPLSPDSDAACEVWDLMRAVRRLPLIHQAVVALTVMGFDETEIGAIVDLDSPLAHALERDRRALSGAERRQLDGKRRRVARMVQGRPERGADGVVDQVLATMNGGR